MGDTIPSDNVMIIIYGIASGSKELFKKVIRSAWYKPSVPHLGRATQYTIPFISLPFPYYHQANGEAIRAVKAAKHLHKDTKS